eukprot:TRINITY_DN8042_c0_g1_i1.p1 TRINITY_DN8042_c0_g1~~TRINITY_DN8042_c0_g1_i1.p1  ORF type:complete len:202 (-),score=31.15 TRINITY_DN8042_c0_g1_i1:38-643(-)
MNVQQFSLDVLEVPEESVKDVVQCILHTILFLRAFGLVKAMEICIESLDFYYMCCDEPTIKAFVQEKANTFFDSWQRKRFDPLQRTIFLSFDEKRMKSQLFGFSQVEERVMWEQWWINLKIVNRSLSSPEGSKRLEEDLQKTVFNILQLANEYKTHIPPLTNKDITPFPYNVTFPTADQSQGLLSTLGNMLKTGSSAPLLT